LYNRDFEYTIQTVAAAVQRVVRLTRNVNWSSSGKWVHAAKIGFERYFLRKIRQGKSETFYEKLALDMLGISKLKEIHDEVA
jgi:sulfide:quinone oxidoreductase